MTSPDTENTANTTGDQRLSRAAKKHREIETDEDAQKAAEHLMRQVTRIAGIKLLQIIKFATEEAHKSALELTDAEKALLERAEWLTRNYPEDDEVRGLVALVNRLLAKASPPSE